MTTLHNIRRSLTTLSAFDDEDDFVSSPHNGGHSGGLEISPVLASDVKSASRRLFITALIDHLCSLYEKSPNRRHRLYEALCDALIKAQILSPTWTVREFSSLRRQLNTGFISLLQAARDSINQDTPLVVSSGSTLHHSIQVYLSSQSLPPQIDCSSDLFALLPSKFAQEFTDTKRISKGAYGKVYQATKQSDGITYAVKEICIDDKESSRMLATFNEVRLMAALDHINVIRYYDNWVEQNASALPRLPAAADNLDEDESVSSHNSLHEDMSLATSRDRVFRMQNAQLNGVSTHDDDSIQFAVSCSVSHLADDQQRAIVPVAPIRGSMVQPTHNMIASVNAARFHGRRINEQRTRRKLVLYIQMELCHMTLKDWLDERNACTGTDIVRDDDNKHILKQILKGIDYIHSQSLLHRDLKPQNIFLLLCNGGGYRVKIGDFGLSRLLTSANSRSNLASYQQQYCPGDGTEQCIEGLSKGVGNNLYSAPEQLQTSSYSTKADMYSIGMILYELYQPFTTCMERIECLRRLRGSQDVGDFYECWPLQANCVRQLTHRNASLRPTANALLHGDGGLFLTKDEMIRQLSARVTELQQQVQQKDTCLAEKDAHIANLELQLRCCNIFAS